MEFVGTFLSYAWWPVSATLGLPASHPALALPFFLAGFVSIMSYLVVVALQNIWFDRSPIDLKKKYGASWALVTGASSGIGKAMVEKLVGQGLNVVLVALDDDMLANTHTEMTTKHPTLQFIKVGVDLSDPNTCMAPIVEATKDLDVSLVFNNAGFITTGFFAYTPIGRSASNYHCNATCALLLTHHFARQMLDKKQKGLIAFTSSSAGFLPNPMSIIYPSTKAWMTMFATSLAAEVRSLGIDVVVVHPSPMATNFFANSDGLGALDAFKRFAVGPEVIADVVFNSAGRTIVRDQGAVTVLLRLLLKVLDVNLLTEIIARTAHTTGDFKAFYQKAMERTKQQ